MTLSGQTLSWAPVSGASAYVLRRRTPGLVGNRQLVYGTSVVPPALPGETVEYFVRTASPGSEWSQAVTITYPATSPSGEPGQGEGSGSAPGGGSGAGPCRATGPSRPCDGPGSGARGSNLALTAGWRHLLVSRITG